VAGEWFKYIQGREGRGLEYRKNSQVLYIKIITMDAGAQGINTQAEYADLQPGEDYRAPE
jgi:hypothetical protein